MRGPKTQTVSIAAALLALVALAHWPKFTTVIERNARLTESASAFHTAYTTAAFLGRSRDQASLSIDRSTGHMSLEAAGHLTLSGLDLPSKVVRFACDGRESVGPVAIHFDSGGAVEHFVLELESDGARIRFEPSTGGGLLIEWPEGSGR